jgi:hypothetical protein
MCGCTLMSIPFQTLHEREPPGILGGNPASSAISQQSVCAQRRQYGLPTRRRRSPDQSPDDLNRMSIKTDVATDYARVRAKLALPECV